jgi:hypothetical protein
MKYYKILTKENYGGFTRFEWNTRGKWMSVKGELVMCCNGFHVIRKKHIYHWIYMISPMCPYPGTYLINTYAKRYLNLYEVEIKGKKIVGDNKTCAQSVRVIKKLEWEDYLK